MLHRCDHPIIILFRSTFSIVALDLSFSVGIQMIKSLSALLIPPHHLIRCKASPLLLLDLGAFIDSTVPWTRVLLGTLTFGFLNEEQIYS